MALLALNFLGLTMALSGTACIRMRMIKDQ
jgi:hypothetical protein